jgi:hypothetical protein
VIDSDQFFVLALTGGLAVMLLAYIAVVVTRR